MNVEDQLRAAGRAVSDQVRDLPELDLRPERATRRGRARSVRRWPGAGRWLIPMAAAAAVVAVAATLVAVKNPPRVTPATSASPSHSAQPAVTAAPVDPEALPRYFVALNGFEYAGPLPAAPGQSGPAKPVPADSVIVGETLTGERLATITPPAGRTFAGVTGAADDRTFVLDSVQLAGGMPGTLLPTQPRTWYLLRIRPGATPVQTLTPLHLPLPSGADVNGIALSPDGTKLAVFYQMPGGIAGFPYDGLFTLRIYSVATGAVLRSWTGDDPVHGSYNLGSSNGLPDPNANLTWTSDGQHLALAYGNSKGPVGQSLRELNVAGPGGDLFKASTVVAAVAASPTTGRAKIWCGSLGMTGDGRSAVCGATLEVLPKAGSWTRCATPTDVVEDPGLVKISLAGDRRPQVIYQTEPQCAGGGDASVLWSSPSGDAVLADVSYVDDGSKNHAAVVLYRHGTVTTLTWPGAASLLLANRTAF